MNNSEFHKQTKINSMVHIFKLKFGNEIYISIIKQYYDNGKLRTVKIVL